MHLFLKALEIVAVIGIGTSSIYYLLCLGSASAFFRELAKNEEPINTSSSPPISILKPLKGTDPEIYGSFRSHCLQDYPQYEIIFGVSDSDDSAVASVDRSE